MSRAASGLAHPRIGDVGAPACLLTPKRPSVASMPPPSTSANAFPTVGNEKDENDEPEGSTRLVTSGADTSVGARKIPRGFPTRTPFVLVVALREKT